jgi:BON domain
MRNVRAIPLGAAVVIACGIAAGPLPSGSAEAQSPVEHNYWDSPGMLRTVLPANEGEDAAVTANVKSAIAANIGPNAAKINVETLVAVVTLSGEVPTTAIRDRAREAARLVSGVVDVIDRIEVRATA